MGRKKGALLSCVMIIVEIFSTLLLTPFVIRSLGRAEYGVYKLSVAIVSYLLLLDLGVGNAVIRYVAKFRFENDKDGCEEFLGISTVYYALVAGIAVAVGVILVVIFPFAFAKGLTAEEISLGQKLLAITTVTNAVMLGTSAFSNTINAYERFHISRGWEIAQCLLKMVVIFFALKMGYNSVALVTIDCVLTFLRRSLFVLYVLFVLKIKPRFHHVDLTFMKEIVTFSSFILLQMVATNVNSFMDQILIGALVKEASVILAVYAIGQQIITYFQKVGVAFTSTLMPGVVKLAETSDRPAIVREMTRVSRIIFGILSVIYVGFLLYGRSFVVLWAGQENEEAFLVAGILMFCYLFICTETIGTQILWALNQHKEQSILKISVVLANIVLTVFLIRWKPLLGATIGTAVALFAGDIVVMNVILKKKLDMSVFRYYISLFKGIAPALALSAAIGYFARLIPIYGWLGFLLKVCIFAAAYAICLLLCGLNKSEKEYLKDILKKLLGKGRSAEN